MAKRPVTAVRFRPVVGLRFDGEGDDGDSTTMRLQRPVADAFRKLARHEGKRLSDLLSDMIVVYVRERHPDAEVDYGTTKPNRED